MNATIISENVLRRPSIDAIIFNCGPLDASYDASLVKTFPVRPGFRL